MESVLYLDCLAGLTPSMFLGALLDVGVSIDALNAYLALPTDAPVLTATRATSGSLAGVLITPSLVGESSDSLPDAAGLLGALHLSEAERVRCQRIVDHLRTVGISDVSATTLVEVAGIVAGIGLLGVEQVFAAPVPLPAIPVNAMLQLIETQRIPTFVEPAAPPPDPVALAVLAACATFRQPALRLHTVGYGIGTRQLDQPDIARLVRGELDDGDQPVLAPSAARGPLLLLVSAGPEEELRPGSAYQYLAQQAAQQMQVRVNVCALAGKAGVTTVLEAALSDGTQEVIVVPVWDESKLDATSDLRGAVQWIQERWPQRRVRQTRPLVTTDVLVGALVQQTSLAMQRAAITASVASVLVVGAGSDVPEENAALVHATRLLWERRGVAWCDNAFWQRTTPSVQHALARLAAVGTTHIVLVPVMIFADTLYNQLAATLNDLRAQFPALPLILAQPLLSVAGAAAMVAQRYAEDVPRFNGYRHSHGHSHGTASALESLLPPRYEHGAAVSAAPMGAADLVYDADGQVAWDAIWTDFCDLALAGGPPHRGSLLEPPTPEQVRVDPVGYQRAMDALVRGLRMVTQLAIVIDAAPGWIGLVCTDESMALWLLRAIIVENVAVRREEATLFLPVGPAFRLDKEIKNVVTVVAKTYHYWTEHANAI